jgi:hypothetical protein
MNKLGKLTLLAAALSPAMVLAQVNVGDALGSSEPSIRAALEAKGYVISDIETEDGEFEVQAMMDGKTYEIEVSADSGQILEIEQEDKSEDS